MGKKEKLKKFLSHCLIWRERGKKLANSNYLNSEIFLLFLFHFPPTFFSLIFPKFQTEDNHIAKI